MTRQVRRTIYSKPDEQGRVQYTDEWDDPAPPWCSSCGGNVEIDEQGITCVGYPSGSTPERRRGCGIAGVPSMPRGQVFFRVPD